MGELTAIFSTKKNKRIFFGYRDGTLELRNSSDLNIQHAYNGLGNIQEIWSDDETFVIVTNSNGAIGHIKLTSDTQNALNESVSYLTQTASPGLVFQLSPDEEILVAYEKTND